MATFNDERKPGWAALRRGRGRFVVLSGVLLAQACTADAVTLGFGASDVEQIEVYLYEFAAEPAEVSRSVITDRVEIAEQVQMLTDAPVTDADDAGELVAGASSAGLRFLLRDGSTSEITRVFAGPKEVVLIWPDGRAAMTEWGSDLAFYGTPSDPDANELVDPDQRPRAVLR
ncbi:MAG: hypothetical protein JJT89_12735 [Nitriliruptoraceae bacterium]|nr:hypothetical protein [Nitriliruptoraceae bacterium]